MATHFEASLQRDIDRIRGKIGEMCAQAERSLKDCLIAMRDQNRTLAYAIILRDQHIDELEKEVDRLCLEFLVRQQPVAGPLRLAYATIRINLELERVGDYAEGIARQVLKLASMKVAIPIDRFQEIADRSIPMLHQAIDAFIRQDAVLAQKAAEEEEAVDRLKSRLNSDLVRMHREEKLPLEALNSLMMVARHLERVSDQARNICIEVLYMCTGEYRRHQGAEATRVLFVDVHDSCRSPMAEAIASALNHPQFIFASAGLKPATLNPDTVAFLRQKGLETAHLSSKGLEQIPNLDHYHIIVALAEEAMKAFPKPPTKVVCIEWTIPDPSLVRGTPAEVNAAHQQTYQFLESHIKDLVTAVIGDKVK